MFTPRFARATYGARGISIAYRWGVALHRHLVGIGVNLYPRASVMAANNPAAPKMANIRTLNFLAMFTFGPWFSIAQDQIAAGVPPLSAKAPRGLGPSFLSPELG
jgi:hypothetical protein